MMQVMCRSCGQFRPATRDADEVVPITEECPDCGSTEYTVPGE